MAPTLLARASRTLVRGRRAGEESLKSERESDQTVWLPGILPAGEQSSVLMTLRNSNVNSFTSHFDLCRFYLYRLWDWVSDSACNVCLIVVLL